jgi:hypothetical protein
VVKVPEAAMAVLDLQKKCASAHQSSFVALAGELAGVLASKPLCCLCSED